MKSLLPSLLLVLFACATTSTATPTTATQTGALPPQSIELEAPAWSGPFETLAAAATGIQSQDSTDSTLELPAGSPFLEGHRLQGTADEDYGYQVVMAFRTELGWYSNTWHAEMQCQNETPTEAPLVDAGPSGRVARIVIEVSGKTECDREEGYEGTRDYFVLGAHQGAVVELGSIAMQQSNSTFSENTDPDGGMWNTAPVEEEWARTVRFDGDTLHLSAVEAQVFVVEGEGEPEGAHEIQNLSGARSLTLEELVEARRVLLTTGAPVWAP